MMFIMWVMMVIGIGFWASKLNRNVFGYVVLAFFLSPLVAAIVLLIAGQKKEQTIVSTPQNPTINVTINNPGSSQPETIVVPVQDTVQEVTAPAQKTVEKPKAVQNKNNKNKNKNKKPQYKSSSTQSRKDDTDVVDYTPNVYTNTAVEAPRSHVTSVGGHSGHSVSHSRHDDSSSYHHSHSSDHSSSYDSGSSYSSSSSD